MKNEESLQKSTATRRGGVIDFDKPPRVPTGYLDPSYTECPGDHRYFVAETFAVEGEGTVGAVIICTSCGESKLITHKVGRDGCSVLLKQKGEKA